MTYPILVEKWPTHPNASLELGCNNCKGTWSERDPEDAMAKVDHGDCPSCGSFDIAFRYDEADRCKGCGTLGYWKPLLKGCCSRRCMLQAEYAETLDGNGAHAA